MAVVGCLQRQRVHQSMKVFFFFFLRILCILTYIHGERGESFKKTDNDVYLKGP